MKFTQEMCTETDERLYDESYYRIADASFFRIYIFENKWDIIRSSKTQIVFSFLDKVLCPEEKQWAAINYIF
jgi:CRISPR/Cas system CMR-associated protein Cmr3 (group 5 of RAMP superfamily)